MSLFILQKQPSTVPYAVLWDALIRFALHLLHCIACVSPWLLNKIRTDETKPSRNIICFWCSMQLGSHILLLNQPRESCNQDQFSSDICSVLLCPNPNQDGHSFQVEALTPCHATTTAVTNSKQWTGKRTGYYSFFTLDFHWKMSESDLNLIIIMRIYVRSGPIRYQRARFRYPPYKTGPSFSFCIHYVHISAYIFQADTDQMSVFSIT